jgi:hypothetical protein
MSPRRQKKIKSQVAQSYLHQLMDHTKCNGRGHSSPQQHPTKAMLWYYVVVLINNSRAYCVTHELIQAVRRQNVQNTHKVQRWRTCKATTSSRSPCNLTPELTSCPQQSNKNWGGVGGGGLQSQPPSLPGKYLRRRTLPPPPTPHPLPPTTHHHTL